ncbi:hypothetical protein RND81_07G104100 [Saponaria officinalis]|uniref:F-box domain-containing protein n=1 Tax=Saponaria officinalis TaxID=3572 RepID=A0AAW1JLW3_SAPOF
MSSATSENRKLCKARTDMIMDLPLNLLQQILECLPLRDAARTSVLSKDWRYKWLSLPHITLDSRFSEAFRKRENTSLDFPRLYSDTVNKILLRHRGPIHKFVFHVPCHLPKSTDIDCWIEFVCQNGVKEFYLNDHRLPKLKPPSCLFSCVSLTHLTLYCGSLSLPSTFRGFPCLISLKLSTCEDDDEKLESLIHDCPQLESLDLILSETINCLNIHVSKLQHLVLSGLYNTVSLEETENIKTLALDIQGGDMVDLLSSMPNIENFQLSNFHECGLEPPKSLAMRLEQLHTLVLGMPLTCQYTISLLLCLFKSSPRLSRLQITALQCTGCVDKLPELDMSCNLEPLKHVELLCFSGSNSELHLVKFLLAQSSTLELMTIQLDTSVIKGADAKFSLARAVMRFRRASPYAEVVLKT